MLISDLEGKKITIWGAGREGLAAAKYIRAHLPIQNFTIIDEGAGPATQDGFEIVRDRQLVAQEIAAADIIIKSPGVSLYHPVLEKEKARGVTVTSLLNIWRAENESAFIIGITGTKGKSTTASLLHHVLTKLGKKSALLGNIGVPVTECNDKNVDYYVIEISSFQAATFSGMCDIGVLTSLFQEHLDWHTSPETYYRDKANLLAHSRIKIIEEKARHVLELINVYFDNMVVYKQDDDRQIQNTYLSRPHNRCNVAAVISIIQSLGFDQNDALKAMESFKGLPHRQQEIGEKDGILYVDDSISTTPQSAIAALENYKDRPVTLIAGGHDRGVDFAPLLDYIVANQTHAVICIGQSGPVLFEALKNKGMKTVFYASTMQEAVENAATITPQGGVILLSPAASSFDMFKDYIDRAEKFCAASGIQEKKTSC